MISFYETIIVENALRRNSASSAEVYAHQLTNLFWLGDMDRQIRDLREDRDLTQREMGEILNCSQRMYGNYEREDLDTPMQILIKLAGFHQVSVDYLLGHTDIKAINSFNKVAKKP